MRGTDGKGGERVFARPRTAGGGRPAALPSRHALARRGRLMVWARSRFALLGYAGSAGLVRVTIRFARSRIDWNTT
jgi:hypothetical protein